jgi:hypothetical protein
MTDAPNDHVLTPAETHRIYAQRCLERTKETSDPAARAWWAVVAQRWHDRAVRDEAK